MNLVEIHARGIPGVTFQQAASIEKPLFGEAALGLDLTPSDQPQITIENVFAHRPLRSFPAWPRWLALAEGEAALTLQLADRKTGGILAERKYDSAALRRVLPVEFPWPPLADTRALDADFRIHATGAPVFISVSRKLDRAEIAAVCKGKGVEIGPGVTPQILPSPAIDVTYAEEKSREDWAKTYAYKMDKYKGDLNALPWERYRVATAFELPAENNSLDFIFASHVLEHLVNPLGHLQHWLSKLKPGGVIAGILPNCDSSGDYQLMPTMLPTIALEYQRRETRPNINHYRVIFGPTAEARMAEGRTLHVHFYNERNLQEFFTWAGGQLPIAAFRIKAEPNYKEFFFMVTRK